MKRTIEVEMQIKTNSAKKAIEKFFQKYPELNYWKDEFEYMADNGDDFECDNTMGDGTKNEKWAYALHLEENGNGFYICVIERA